MHPNILLFQFFHETFAPGFQHGADDSRPGVIAGEPHIVTQAGSHQTIEILRHIRGRQKFFVIAEPDERLAINGPVNQPLAGFLPGVFRKAAEIRRRIRLQDRRLPESQQAWHGGFNDVRQVAAGFCLGENPLDQRRGTGSIGLDFYAGVFGFECVRNLFILIGRERGVPDQFPFAPGGVQQQSFSIGSRIRSQFR